VSARVSLKSGQVVSQSCLTPNNSGPACGTEWLRYRRATLRLEEITRADASKHILQSFDGCGCGFASAAGAPFSLVANRRVASNYLLWETPCLSRSVLSALPAKEPAASSMG
jgi:hypothetical protein